MKRWKLLILLSVAIIGAVAMLILPRFFAIGSRSYRTDNGSVIKYPSNALTTRIGRGIVVRHYKEEPPEPEPDLGREKRLENFDILAEAIDRYYSFFIIKNIDWAKVRDKYRLLAAQAEGEEFYNVIVRLVRELKDSHSYVYNYLEPVFRDWNRTEIHFRKIEGKAVVTIVAEDSSAYKQGVRVGSVITEVDGVRVEDRIEQLRQIIGAHSSEKAFLQAAHRQLLHGPQDSNVKITFQSPDAKDVLHASFSRKKRDYRRRSGPPFSFERNNYVWHGVHPSGIGYILITSFRGRMDGAQEFDSALEDLRETPALILDIRDNGGGFGTGQRQIIGRLLTKRAKGSISFVKRGSDHNDFKTFARIFGPRGDWQYTKPVALLLNAGTGSASDLFAAGLISTGRVITVGTPSNGNLRGTSVFAVLPCGLVVRISRGYIADADGNVIEGRGNIPQIYAERTIGDVINGTDSVIDRAVMELKSQITD